MAITDFINKFGGWTEKYLFYDGEIELRYDPKDHVYLRVTDDGELEEQKGVTNVCHILDKSDALVPWGCKMMAQKLLRTIPVAETANAYIFSHDQLENWVLDGKSAHQEKLEEAGAIGHMAHNWVESFIKLLIAKKYDEAFNLAQALPENESSANACVAALDWMAKHNVQWIETERKIYSRKYRYAGTMDGLARVSSCGDSHCQGCRGKKPWVDRLTVVDWKTSNYLYLEYLFQTAAYEQAFEEEHGVDIEDRWVIRLGKDDAAFDPWHLDKTNFPSDFGGFVMCLDLTRRVEQLKKRIADVKAGIRAAYREERRIAREAKDALLVKERAEAKAEKQAARLVALAGDCGGSKKGYKGFKKPNCKTDEGGPCRYCAGVWAEAQINPPKRAKKGEGKPAKVPVAKVTEKRVDTNAINSLEAIANRPKDRPKPASVSPANGSVGTPDRITSMLARETRSSGGLLGRFR
jgi:hypothetical protein